MGDLNEHFKTAFKNYFLKNSLVTDDADYDNTDDNSTTLRRTDSNIITQKDGKIGFDISPRKRGDITKMLLKRFQSACCQSTDKELLKWTKESEKEALEVICIFLPDFWYPA